MVQDGIRQYQSCCRQRTPATFSIVNALDAVCNFKYGQYIPGESEKTWGVWRIVTSNLAIRWP